jgi:hypothetical protein
MLGAGVVMMAPPVACARRSGRLARCASLVDQAMHQNRNWNPCNSDEHVQFTSKAMLVQERADDIVQGTTKVRRLDPQHNAGPTFPARSHFFRSQSQRLNFNREHWHLSRRKATWNPTPPAKRRTPCSWATLRSAPKQRGKIFRWTSGEPAIAQSSVGTWRWTQKWAAMKKNVHSHKGPAPVRHGLLENQLTL